MNTSDIEYMWKVATNDPNHDTNWYDPVVVAFAKLVANHTMANIDPSKFMSYQEGIEASRLAEREACAKVCDSIAFYEDDPAGYSRQCATDIRARGQS